MKFNHKVLADRIKTAFEFDPIEELAITYYNEGMRSGDINIKLLEYVERGASLKFQNCIRDLEVAEKYKNNP